MLNLTQEQIDSYNKNGFVKGGQLLTNAEVDTLLNELTRVTEDFEQTGRSNALSVKNISSSDRPVIQIVNIWMGSEAFRSVMMRADLGRAVQQLMDCEEVRIWHDQIQHKPSRTGGVNMWHQDWPYWSILEGPSQVTAWVALDDAEEDNGCMSMVPGSHLWGQQIDFLHELEDYEAMPDSFAGNPIQIVRCPVKKGEVHFHHSLTWHGSHSNTSGRQRRAIALHYMSEDTLYINKGNHMCKKLVEVAEGEKLDGKHFPLIYSNAPA